MFLTAKYIHTYIYIFIYIFCVLNTQVERLFYDNLMMLWGIESYKICSHNQMDELVIWI